MRFVVRIENEQKTVVVEETNGFYDVEIDGKAYKVDCKYVGTKGFFSLLIDNKSYLIESAPVQAKQGQYYARVMGRHYDVEVLDELMAAVREAKSAPADEGEFTVKSPMPGLILDVMVAVGDEVAAGTPVIVMEAMKMQNELTADVGGIVKEVHVASGGTVDSQAPLIVIEKN